MPSVSDGPIPTLVGGLALAGALGSQSHVRRDTAAGSTSTWQNSLGKDLAETSVRASESRCAVMKKPRRPATKQRQKQRKAMASKPVSKLTSKALWCRATAATNRSRLSRVEPIWRQT